MTIYNLDTETESGLNAFYGHFKTDSPLFVAIEAHFDEWITSRARPDEVDMYESDDAIYTKKGAIHQAIEDIFDIMREENMPFISLNHSFVDLEAAFQG